MGYLTQNLVAQSAVFQSKVQTALTKLVDANLTGSKEVMAKAVMHDLPRYAEDMAVLLAIDGLDLDSADGAIDTALVAHIDWLEAKTSK